MYRCREVKSEIIHENRPAFSILCVRLIATAKTTSVKDVIIYLTIKLFNKRYSEIRSINIILETHVGYINLYVNYWCWVLHILECK